MTKRNKKLLPVPAAPLKKQFKPFNALDAAARCSSVSACSAISLDWA
jgi:hypothetical protein